MTFLRTCLANFLLLPGLLIAAGNPPLTINDPWIREAPPGQKILAGYMQIHNDSAAPVKVSSVSSAAFESVEIHKTVVVDGVARMEAQPVLEVPAAGVTVLEPGGLHLMLIGPHRALKAGDTIELELHIVPDKTQTITAIVRRSDVDAVDHSHHHHH